MKKVFPCILLGLLVYCSGTVSVSAQPVWSRAAGVKAGVDCRLESNNSFSILYNSKDVLFSGPGGYMWWSIRQHFSDGLVASCVHSNQMFGMSVDPHGLVYLHSASSDGGSWERRSVFSLPGDESIVDMVSSERRLIVFTTAGTIYHSDDGGIRWTQRTIQPSLGTITDVAYASGVWVACGTNGVAWCTDSSTAWYPMAVPVQIGGAITLVEAFKGTIWAGGLFGTARMNLHSHSWEPMIDGLPAVPALFPRPIELRELGGNLFGIFRSNTENMVYRWGGGMWLAVDRGGLPPGDHVRRFSIGLQAENLLVYASGTDINFQGIYVVRHGLPTNVPETIQEPVLWPVPATDVLYVSTETTYPTYFTICDATGSIVSKGSLEDSRVINVSELPSGYYLLQVMRRDNLVSAPFVIHK